MSHKIESQLEQISAFIRRQQLVQKQILNLAEAAEYTGLSRSYLYKKTASRELRFYRLHQKLLYFKREDLDAHLLSNPQPTVSEMTEGRNQLKGRNGQEMASSDNKSDPSTTKLLVP